MFHFTPPSQQPSSNTSKDTKHHLAVCRDEVRSRRVAFRRVREGLQLKCMQHRQRQPGQAGGAAAVHRHVPRVRLLRFADTMDIEAFLYFKEWANFEKNARKTRETAVYQALMELPNMQTPNRTTRLPAYHAPSQRHWPLRRARLC